MQLNEQAIRHIAAALPAVVDSPRGENSPLVEAVERN
jgi:hypothetical protein